jgi:hypothetical protein
MGLIETGKQCAEQSNFPLEQQLPQETEAERKQRILRQKMRVYPARSLTGKTRAATASDV